MAQGEGFKHITVTPPEEEDEVIFAGAPSQADVPTQAQGVDGNASDNALTQPAPPEVDGATTPDGEPPLPTPLATAPSGNGDVTTPDDEPPLPTPLATVPSGTDGTTTPDDEPPLPTPLATAPSGTGRTTTPDDEPPLPTPLATVPSGNGDVTTPDDEPPLPTPLATVPSGNGDVTTPDDEPPQSIPSVGAHSVRPASEASVGDLAVKGAPQPVKPSKDPYRDPTLEDLHGAPMPLTQKIVITAALVCIIGAVIYYLAFMG